MIGTEIAVVALGIGAILWVNWYFFVAGQRVPAVAASSQSEIVITVDGGYSPNAVRVAAGKPVKLIFDRRDDSSCSEEVVFPDFGIRRFLPSGERTTIEITPPAAGQYGFTCGMSMLRGKLVVDE